MKNRFWFELSIELFHFICVYCDQFHFHHGACHSAPLTLFKVLKHIHECQHEVKSSIFHEALTLIKEHAFHHPHDSHSLNVHDLLHAHDTKHEHHEHFADRNFTLTEQEILRFFEENDHLSGTGNTFTQCQSIPIANLLFPEYAFKIRQNVFIQSPLRFPVLFYFPFLLHDEN